MLDPFVLLYDTVSTNPTTYSYSSTRSTPSTRVLATPRVQYQVLYLFCAVLEYGGNLISAPTTDLQGRYGVVSIKWP
jgi:hypothetical protein